MTGNNNQSTYDGLKSAAGSANLMSPQISAQNTLGANKRIRDDMISKYFF